MAGVGWSALDVGLEHVVLHDGVAAARVGARLSLARQHRLLRGVVHAAMRLRIDHSVADPDPGSGAFLTPGSGMGKKTGTGSGMNNPDYIS